MRTSIPAPNWECSLSRAVINSCWTSKYMNEQVKTHLSRLQWRGTTGLPQAYLLPCSHLTVWLFCLLASLSYARIFFFFNVVDLQWCVSFRCTAKWFRYIYMCVCVCVYICSFSDSFPSWLLQNVEYSSLCCAVGPGQLSIRMLLSFMFCFSLLRASKSQFFFQSSFFKNVIEP